MEEEQRNNQGINPLLVIFLFSGLVGLILAGVTLLMQDSPGTPTANGDSGFVRTRSVNDWVADDFTLTTLDGETASLSDFDGKTVFLNFWRTDCAPCVRELPAFHQFMQEQDDAVVLAVNQGEVGEDIREFLTGIELDPAFPVLLDQDLEVESDYPINALPTTYVIDSAGNVRYTKIGEMSVEDMYLYIDAITEADAEATEAPVQG